MTVIKKKLSYVVSLSLEERMRLLANLLIDKIIDDYQKGDLKIPSQIYTMSIDNKAKYEN